jgi:hypothetical protein
MHMADTHAVTDWFVTVHWTLQAFFKSLVLTFPVVPRNTIFMMLFVW